MAVLVGSVFYSAGLCTITYVSILQPNDLLFIFYKIKITRKGFI